jgi:hypothetical protein
LLGWWPRCYGPRVKAPTYQFLRTVDAINTGTIYGPVQVIPVVCERCNDVSYITAPSDIPTFCAVVRVMSRKHRRCSFRPLDDAAPAGEWAQRWEHAFRWIAWEAKRRLL